MVPLVEMLSQSDGVWVELFVTGRSDTLKHHYLGDVVRYLKHVGICFLVCVIFQWGPPGNVISVKL